MATSSKRMPLFIMLSGCLFNIMNSYLNARYISHFQTNYYLNWLIDPRFLIGITMFIIGFSLNILSDAKLRALKSQTTDYSIPNGGMFNLVSCPNYLGEIIEWIGWAIATWSLPGLAFALFTAANLAPRALSYHRWYQQHFPNYPPSRKAIIPFLL